MMVRDSKRILVTGAGGFAGGIVARYLEQLGWDVTGTVHRHEAKGNFSTVNADLSQPWKFPGRYNVIVHTAGALPYQEPSMLEYKRSNIDVMQYLVEYAQRTGVKRVIYFSTIGVYGDFRGNTAVDEDTDIVNPDAYGMTKYIAECMLRESGLENISLRMPGLIGPGARPVWFTKTVEKFRRNEPITIYAPDFRTRNFVWAEDVAGFIAHLLVQPSWLYDRLVIACKNSAGIMEIINEIKQLTGSISEISVDENMKQPFCLNPLKALMAGYTSRSPLDIVRMYIRGTI